MKELFVPYELALALKEKGFDEPCLAAYTMPDNKFKIMHTHFDFTTPAPLYQQVVDWFREKHKIIIEAIPILRKGHEYFGKFTILIIVSMELRTGYLGNFNTYYEALTKAIEKALKLI